MKHEAVFLKRPVVAGSIWFVFCFRLNIFTSKISISKIVRLSSL